jgi:hypothetical protein
MPNKVSYLPNISHHMEQVLPEDFLGEIQIIVRPYVQFTQGSELPRNVLRCHHRCWACVKRPSPRSPHCVRQAEGSL